MIGHDLRVAVRGLAKQPLMASLAMVTIAIAIAGNTAIFSALNGVLLRPLPFAHPDRLVTPDVRAPTGHLISLSIPNYRDWRERSRVFETAGAAAGWSMTLTGHGSAQVVDERLILGDFFGTLGLAAGIGRVIRDAETGPGAAPVVVLGYGFWQRVLGGDPAAIGRTITLDDHPYTIVGVLRQGTGYPSDQTEVYAPMGAIADRLPWNDRGSSFGTRMYARLRPGVTLETARADLRRVGREVQDLEGRPVAQPELRTLSDLALRDVRRPLWILMGGVAFVLLIAVANVGNLLLTRGEGRRKEVAVRSALGAPRALLVRQLLVESLVLAFAGGVIGLALAFAAVRVLVHALPEQIPTSLLQRVGVDWAVALFALAVTTVAAVAAGLVPALRAGRVDLGSALRESTRGTTGARGALRSALVVAEVALAMILLIGAGLMVRSLDRLRHADKGFVTDNVLTARIPAARAKYPDKERWRAFYEELLQRAERVPGVRAAALTLLIPLSDRSWEQGVLPAGVPFDPQQTESMLYNMVSERYFETFGVPILRGRAFTDADRDGADPVVIIDETMAQKFWPGHDPIGKRVTFDMAPGSTEDHPIPVYRTVVGVAKNVRHYELSNPSRIQAYVPVRQTLERWGATLNLALKTSVPPGTLIRPITDLVASIDPDAPVTEAQALGDYVDSALSGERSLGGLLAVFSAVALLLAGVGVFGVMSYTVTQRMGEIGIRMALGADATRVLRWMSRKGLVLAGTGVAIGLIAAALCARLLSSLLYEVSPLDPVIYGALALFLLFASFAAAYVPARRATRVDPARVLNIDA